MYLSLWALRPFWRHNTTFDSYTHTCMHTHSIPVLNCADPRRGAGNPSIPYRVAAVNATSNGDDNGDVDDVGDGEHGHDSVRELYKTVLWLLRRHLCFVVFFLFVRICRGSTKETYCIRVDNLII